MGTIGIDQAKSAGPRELFEQLSASEDGLTAAEARDRLSKYGPNDIEEKRVRPIVKFLRYFWGPIPAMIIAAMVLSAAIGHWEDFFIILALLVSNAAIGFYQENKAGNAIGSLKKKLALEARVRRDGKWTDLPARELVPGDIAMVRLGDVVPADLKLFRGDYLEVDQSALTGESLPAEKKIGDVGYSGSIVQKGEMQGLVITTGANTFFGKTAQLVEGAKTSSHFQHNVVRIGDFLIMIDIFLVAIVLIAALLRHQSLLEALQFALVLTIAAIPVALPAVLSVTMAVGAIALAKKEAIVSKLVAIEEMAGMDVLCSDKTGTITQNKLSVGEVRGYRGHSEDEVVLSAALASRAEDRDRIDDAILDHARSREGPEQAVGGYEIKGFVPFDPVTKRTEASVAGKGREFRVTKGAPQVVLGLSGNKNDLDEEVRKDVEDLASQGYRALGVARKDGGEWSFIGIIGLHDPPRPDSAETIGKAIEAGLALKMVTGDHSAIAREIASEVGMNSSIAEAGAFVNEPEDRAAEIVEKADGFAEVFPEHKYRIVKLLQDRGHIVGMTGDGVNDAPALKKADVGIAVEGSTDAAKSAADIVLTRPGLSVVIDAMIQSRLIFQRMINYSIYRISETIRVLFFITLSILIFQFYPITAIMIVLLALLNDLPILTIAFDNVLYSAKPEKWDMSIVLTVATYLGMIGLTVSFVVLYIGLDIFHLSVPQLQSFVYLKLSVGGHFVLLVARTKGPFWTVRPAPQLLGAIILTQLTATSLVLFGILLPPLPLIYVAFIWAEAFTVFFITDALKVLLYRRLVKRGKVAMGIAPPAEERPSS